MILMLFIFRIENFNFINSNFHKIESILILKMKNPNNNFRIFY